MGPGRPLVGSVGGVALHKEQRNMRQHGRDCTSSFTQVRAAARHKTLLLLWWIDGGMWIMQCSTLARQGSPYGSSDYARMGV